MSFCLCWFHFELNFFFACFSSAFFSNFFFKYSTADSLIYAMICGEWQQWTSACEWVDACVSVAMPQWLSLRGSGHASRNRVWSCVLLRGWHVWSFFSVCDDGDDHTWWLQHLHCWTCMYVTAHLSCIFVIHIFLDVLNVLTCDACKFAFVRIVMHANAWLL